MNAAPPSVYFDQAATSWPKPPVVLAAMQQYMAQCGVGYGRSTGRQADQVRATVDGLRLSLAHYLRADADEVLFTFSATDALNLAIQGLMLQRFGGRVEEPRSSHGTNAQPPSSGSATGPAWSATGPALVLATPFEHNSVLRPLQAWAQRGWIRLEILPYNGAGEVDLPACQPLFQQGPVLVCVTHASNVTGIIQPVAAIGESCRRSGAIFLVDAAQTLGWLPVDVQQWSCDILVAAGHKALHGPLGTGLAFVRRAIQPQIASLRLGGLGSTADDRSLERLGPQKWEAGNLNVPGLVGLAAALSDVSDLSDLSDLSDAGDLNRSLLATATFERAGSARLARTRKVGSRLWSGLARISGVRLLENWGEDPFVGSSSRLPIISLTVEGWEPTELALAMESAGGFITRAGYHCAPLIHPILGTGVGGTWRLSLGPSNTAAEVDYFLETLEAVCQL